MGQQKSKSVVAKQHKCRYAVQPKRNFTHDDLDNWTVLKNSSELQMLLYKSGDLVRMEVFFDSGGCFGQKIQQRIIDDNNVLVLKLFLKYWEFVPQMRQHMLKKAPLDFVLTYVENKSLGKFGVDLVKNVRFSKSFIQHCFLFLNREAKRIACEVRKINRVG